MSPWWATNVKWVRAEPVATTLAPETWMPPLGLLGDARVDVGGPAGGAGRQVAVDRRVDDRVVDERHPLLGVPVPAPGVVLVGRVELGVRPERAQERGLVVGRAAEPAVGDARPRRDRVAAGHLLLHRRRRPEVAMREPAPLGGLGEHVLAARVVVVQRVVQAGEHPGAVLERRVRGDVLHPLAVDPHLPPVVEALEELLAGVRERRRLLRGGSRRGGAGPLRGLRPGRGRHVHTSPMRRAIIISPSAASGAGWGRDPPRGPGPAGTAMRPLFGWMASPSGFSAKSQ